MERSRSFPKPAEVQAGELGELLQLMFLQQAIVLIFQVIKLGYFDLSKKVRGIAQR